MSKFILLALALASPVQAQTISWNCVLDDISGTNLADGEYVKTNMVFEGMPADAWQYQLTFSISSENAEMVIQSSMDPAQLNGQHPVLPLRDGVYATFAMSDKGCMFSEQFCASMVQFTQLSDDKAVLEVTPASFGSTDSKYAEFLDVELRGNCAPVKESK